MSVCLSVSLFVCLSVVAPLLPLLGDIVIIVVVVDVVVVIVVGVALVPT